MNARSCMVPSALLVASLLLAACSSTPVTPAVDAKPATIAGPAASTAPAALAAQTAPAPVAARRLPAYLDPQSALYKDRSIYFDFDRTIVKTDYAPLLEQHGKFLANHPAVSIRIEGNTDEIGGAEYNLALGQKRAEAVLKALEIYGVKDAQMEAVSLGEEKPKAMGHDETAYAQNRRADLVYPTK